jgi:hypothetical protein
VVSALALITALAIDPLASTAPESSAAVSWALGAEGQSLAGLVHGSGVGGGGFVDVTGSARGLIPSFRASFFAVMTRATFSGAVGADLEWYVVRMEACPIRFAGTSDLGLSLCAALDVGILHSSGIGLQTDGTQMRPWFAPAVLGRVVWSPTDTVLLEAGVGPTVPVTRYSFYFEQSGRSEAPLQRILPVAVTLGVNAGYRLAPSSPVRVWERRAEPGHRQTFRSRWPTRQETAPPCRPRTTRWPRRSLPSTRHAVRSRRVSLRTPCSASMPTIGASSNGASGRRPPFFESKPSSQRGRFGQAHRLGEQLLTTEPDGAYAQHVRSLLSIATS